MGIFVKILKFLIILIFLINFSLSENCPRDKPIFKSNECISIYCSQEEFSSGECLISNKYIKIQWLNEFHTFGKGNMSHISVTQNNKGELFLLSQKIDDNYDKYMFTFDSEGKGLFRDKENEKNNCLKVFDFYMDEHADYYNYAEINKKEYLIGVPTNDKINLIDYNNNKIISFNIEHYSISSDTIFKINNSDDIFFTAYIFCKDQNNKNCFLNFQTFQYNSTNITFLKNITNISTISESRINCFQNEKNYILCFYTKKVEENEINGLESNPSLEHYLSKINPLTFEFEDMLLIENDFKSKRIFDETLHLKNDLYILAYSVDDEVIKIQFKNIIIHDNLIKSSIICTDYFSNIKEIYINKNRTFDLGNDSFKRNSICKINDNKFAVLVNDYSNDSNKVANSIVLIYIFTIFNYDKNINSRRYSIDFKLYDRFSNDYIRGYTLGDFFGIILGLTQDISSKSSTTFFTFGYVNSTEQDEIDTKLKYNNTNSKIMIGNYINEIENNLFGYDFLGVNIISLPSEEDSGYFINEINNEKIKENKIIPRNSVLNFILSNTFRNGIYSLTFAGVVREPEYEIMNKFSEELINYPEENENISEKEFYEPKTIIGRKINYKFQLNNCYDSCSTCIEFSKDEKNQKCTDCREGFYFIKGTNNCYDKINEKYYFDEKEKLFIPCYKDCLTCSTKENDNNEMNCLSCDNDFKFYNKSKNCLNCPKYVNYEQNNCIEAIPEGYYLEDKIYGILGKCHPLCKSCREGPLIINSELHMNCETCLYENKNYESIYQGNCPDSSEIMDPDSPVDGKCPADKPILKDGKCTAIYCTKEQYDNNICQILNPIIEIQWLNEFHTFSEFNSSSICFASDIISNNKFIFFAQNVNKENEYIEKYIYGFYKNGNGLFYNKNKNIFESFKVLNFQEKNKLIEKIGYLEMDYEGFLLTAPLENDLYLIDYEHNEIIKKEIDIPGYSADKLILMEAEDESVDPDYTISYIYCKDLIKLNECYLMMKNFEADGRNLEENISLKPVIKLHYNSQLNCYKDEQSYIRCTYTTNEDDSTYRHVLAIFSSVTFSLSQEIELEKNYDPEPTFDSMISLRLKTCIIAYSAKNNKNIIKILIKKIERERYEFKIEDYITQIPEILINEDNLYKFEGAKASSNSIVKISYDKFALLVNNFRYINNADLNSEIVIFILTIYGGLSKINIRHYIINFSLYNTFIDKKIIGYNFNGFLGALVELTSPENNDLKRASFFTFGYINSTKEVEPFEGTEKIILKSEKIKINDYLNKIENNLFGYDFSIIQIISVPDENNSGFFTINKNKLKPDDRITITSEISFIISDKPKTGNYSIVFAPIIREPVYDIMNSFCQKIETYPKNEIDTEYKDYIPKELIGKYFYFNFYIKAQKDCYQNCETCYLESDDLNNQLCIECKENYYKVYGTDNCFESKSQEYYFDKHKKLFMPCYSNCLSCNDSGTEQKMNCLSCNDDLFNYYKKSTNCMNCPMYIDYSQTKCINEIPDGYYLKDLALKTIEKCHELCQTCEKNSSVVNGIIYMNCKTCKYTNISKIKIEGNCPTEFDKDDDDKSSNSIIWILSIIIIIIFIVTIVVIIIYKKYYDKGKTKDQDDYYKMKGNDIKLEDEPISGIN